MNTPPEVVARIEELIQIEYELAIERRTEAGE